MSDEDEFLKRCRQRAGDKQKHGDEIRTVYQSPAYGRLLVYAENLKNQEAYLLARLKEADENQLPPELFDGFSVFKNLKSRTVPRTTSDHITDVLDAVVRMIRERLNNG